MSSNQQRDRPSKGKHALCSSGMSIFCLWMLKLQVPRSLDSDQTPGLIWMLVPLSLSNHKPACLMVTRFLNVFIYPTGLLCLGNLFAEVRSPRFMAWQKVHSPPPNLDLDFPYQEVTPELRGSRLPGSNPRAPRQQALLIREP